MQLARRKEAGKLKAIVVTGCLAERYQTEIRKELPEVDAVLGIGANKDIALALKEALEGHKKELFASKYDLSLSGERVLSTPKFYAYLKISDGCDNCCTYCAIPLIRGRFRSRTMEDIVTEAKTTGCKRCKRAHCHCTRHHTIWRRHLRKADAP